MVVVMQTSKGFVGMARAPRWEWGFAKVSAPMTQRHRTGGWNYSERHLCLLNLFFIPFLEFSTDEVLRLVSSKRHPTPLDQVG